MSKQSTFQLLYNTGFSLSATLLSRAAHIILFVLVSRLSGAADAGIFTIGLSFLAIAGRFSAWGLDQILIRDGAGSLPQLSKYLSNFLVIRLGLAFITSAIIYKVLVWTEVYPPDLTWLVYILTLNIFPEGILDLCKAVFIAHERLVFVTALGGIGGGLKLLLGSLSLWLGFGVAGVIWSLLAANIMAAVIAISLVVTRFVNWRWNFDVQFCISQLKIAFPFLLMAGVLIIDDKIDTLLVSWQVSEAQVGLYGAAMTLTTGLRFVPQAYRDAVFPRLSRTFLVNKPAFIDLYRQSYKYLLLMAFPVALGLLVLAEPIMSWLFGEEFAPAASVLQVVAISIGIQFFTVFHNCLMIIRNWQHKIVFFLTIGLLTNLAINLLLVPNIGISGAAVARTTSNVLVFGMTYLIVFRNIDAFNAIPHWVRVCLAGSVMVVFLMPLMFLPVWSLVIIGALVYGFALILLGTFSRREMVFWFELVKLTPLSNKLLKKFRILENKLSRLWPKV